MMYQVNLFAQASAMNQYKNKEKHPFLLQVVVRLARKINWCGGTCHEVDCLQVCLNFHLKSDSYLKNEFSIWIEFVLRNLFTFLWSWG